MTNLLTSLQSLSLPNSSSIVDEEYDEQGLQLLIDLARQSDLSRKEKLDRLQHYVEDAIGMVEFLSLFRFIKSSSDPQVHESPLNLYSAVLPTVSALVLLENDF